MHPPRQGGYRRIVFVLTLIVVPIVMLKVFEHPLWAFFATVFLLGTTTAYWLPTRYTISHDGILVRRWFWSRRKLFRDLKRIERDPNGLFVSPFPQPSRLDGHRGLLLMEPPNSDAVLDFIRQRIAGSPEHGS